MAQVTVAKLLTAAGTGLQVMGQIQQGRAAEAEAKSAANMSIYNAKVQEQEARAIEQKSMFDSIRQAKEGEKFMSTLQANIGASGGAGSALMVQAKSAEEIELENLLIGYEGQVGAQRARTQAELDRMQAKIYKQQGKSAKRASYIKAGTSLLQGFGSTV